MPKRPARPRTWLLSVVSAASVASACAEQHEAEDEAPTGDELEPDQARSLDAGRPPPARDAGYFQGVVLSDGGFVGTIVYDGGIYPPGVVVHPVDGSLPFDASFGDGGKPDAGKVDAACPDSSLLNGIILVPSDGGCEVHYPGILLRKLDDE